MSFQQCENLEDLSYCKRGMHYNCEAKFDFDCTCGCGCINNTGEQVEYFKLKLIKDIQSLQ